MTTTTFRFHLFGVLRLHSGGQPIILPPQPAAVCAFLVLNRQRRITREELQTLFWPDAEPAKAQERLRRSLYLLRRALEPHEDLIAAEGTELAIAPDVALWVDAEEFERLLLDAHRTEPPDRALLERAVDLYKDDLLKQIYADWALLEREHARQRLLIALRHLIGLCQDSGDWPAVLTYAHRLLELDPLQEVAHRALMTAHAATGDRSAALRVYQQCVKALDEELGADPLPETTALYEAIRAGEMVSAIPVTPPAPPPAASQELQQVPLVGRDAEMAEIAAEWRICQSGHSRLLLITGPAGMGKSRLVQEAAARLPGAGVTLLTGSCYAMEAGTPYHMIAEVMNAALPHLDEPLDPVTRADLIQLVPSLQANARESQVIRLTAAPDTAVRLQEAVTTVLRRLASTGRGLWLIAEDLHWADPASLACLNHALRRCAELPFMVLATLRDEEVSFDSPLLDWPSNSVHAPAPTTRIQLGPLPPERVHDLLGQITAGSDADRLMAFLTRETAGNPFFMVETLRALLEQGILRRDEQGILHLSNGIPVESDGLPLSGVVLQTIRGRIRRLTRPAQDLLTAAAVLEHDLDERLLAQLVDPTSPVDLALDEVLNALILAETAPGRYEFTHIKVREIIYADTSAPRRRFLHRRAGEALAASTAAATLPETAQLAYHFGHAHEWARALLYEWRAARTAQLAGAMAEANRYAENVQTILDQHGPNIDAATLPEALDAIRFDMLALRAEFRRQAATGGLYYPPDLITAIDALVPALDEPRQARAALQQATHRLGQGDLAGAQEAATRGHQIYTRLGDGWGQMDALQHAIEIAYRSGDIVAMHDLVNDMRALSKQNDLPEIRQALAQTEMRLAVYAGNWMEVLRLAKTLSTPSQLDPAIAWLPLANLGLAYLKLGAYDEAADVAQEARRISEETGVLGLGARVLLAQIELTRNHPTAARDMLRDLLVAPDPLIGEVEVVSPALTLVRCCVALGDDAEAKKWAGRASQAMSRVRLPILYPLPQVAWAITHLAAERYEDALRRLSYPLEYIMLLEDTSPQEIFALRAAAAHGLGDESTAQGWIAEARAALDNQAAEIGDDRYRASFLEQVSLHDFIMRASEGAPWQPQDALALPQTAHRS
ncbi:MAG TPA: BTAD domain-containing putative transcriptional regulator [Aggregatilinea sp.]|uniref:ATP-binding protein n=1 Tax=Aggregatilinea sp. TaxID=2806333 RepID=UPI002BBC1BA1|nr:BTAD domain-containing putative transcriptional regulator [Aggregatilinea sp.]HML20455.1 BTAD domain-containing putative transcriptional regulator [Aggregatilinea sp.]